MAGLERADSVTVDPHKWFFQAYDIGALLVRRRRDLTDTFHRSPEYYRGGGTGLADEAEDLETVPLNFYQLGMEGTRRWRALKLWMSWKHLGTNGLGRLVEANVDTAAYLARRIAESDDFDALPSGRRCPSYASGTSRWVAGARIHPAQWTSPPSTNTRIESRSHSKRLETAG